MIVSETADAANRVASAAMYGGAGVSASTGVSMYLGLSPGEWQVVGIVGGLVIGFLGLIANVAVTAYFKWQHLRLARERLEASDEVG